MPRPWAPVTSIEELTVSYVGIASRWRATLTIAARPPPRVLADDQFSFCVTAFKSLFRQRPFPATSFAELKARVTADKPPTVPATRMPRRVTSCILRGLAVDPEKRFPAISDLAVALRGARKRASRVAIAAFVATLRR